MLRFSSLLVVTALLPACTIVTSTETDPGGIDHPYIDPEPAKPSTPTEPQPVEPEVACGATEAVKCGGGKRCASADDCQSGVCTSAGVCLYAPSCNRDHGGSTCGPDGKGEDCCTSLPVRVGSRKVNLDKYNITAGRMRTFIESTKGDVRGYIEKNPPKNWDPRWSAFLPSGFEGNYNVWDQLGPAPLYEQVSQGSRTFGCYLNGGGARTYWVPAEVSEAYGDQAQAYSQEVLDEKPLNCASAVLMAALCASDGGRLPTPAELDAAWGTAKFPWGNAPAPYNPKYSPGGALDYANHGDTFEFPETIGSDVSSHIAPPGHYPKGNGPFGHADLVGNVWNITSAVFQDGPYTPDPLRQWLQWSRGGAWEAGQMVPFENVSIQGEPGFYPRFRAPALRKYWAGGARCVHD
ncbi:MAG: SUMF1/EgtB/PvdO family nonheme iron enzyme [Polyangiaceae bacterium]|nr:SUMF1/EgtB/PvdO family nonheme iron enzyme [Polyangiaceae bacterium]